MQSGSSLPSRPPNTKTHFAGPGKSIHRTAPHLPLGIYGLYFKVKNSTKKSTLLRKKWSQHQVMCHSVVWSVFSVHYTVSALGKIKWEKHYNSPGTLLPKFCDYILSALCHRYHKLIKSFHAWPLLTMLSEKRGLLITTHFWQLPRGSAAFCSSEMTPQLTYWMLNIDSYYECCQTQSAVLQIRSGRSSGIALANVRSGIKGLLDSLGMRFIDSIKCETDQVLVMMEMVVAEWGWACSDVDLKRDASHKWPLKKMLKVGRPRTRTTAALG